MKKEEFEKRFKELEDPYDCLIIRIKGGGFIRATRYECINDNYIKFINCETAEYDIVVGELKLKDIEDIVRE